MILTTIYNGAFVLCCAVRVGYTCTAAQWWPHLVVLYLYGTVQYNECSPKACGLTYI